MLFSENTFNLNKYSKMLSFIMNYLCKRNIHTIFSIFLKIKTQMIGAWFALFCERNETGKSQEDSKCYILRNKTKETEAFD